MGVNQLQTMLDIGTQGDPVKEQFDQLGCGLQWHCVAAEPL